MAASLRIRVKLRHHRLDRELADGCAPDSSDDRALRAGQLVDVGTRRKHARALRRIVAEAEAPRATRLGAGVPICRDAVIESREGLLGLADRLGQPAALNPCGVARLLALLEDGSGPLFNSGAERSLGNALWWIVDGLQPCPPHDWGCPVIMKLDPDHVAWTCGRCGAIALTDDPAVRSA